MFSTYMIAEDMDLTSVMSPIVDDVIIVKDFLGAAFLTEWNYNGIGNLQVGQGYQIKTSSETSLEVAGNYAFPEEYPINLGLGWNMIGYLREEPSNTVAVFSEINDEGNLEIVKDFTGSAYLPAWEFNGLGNMQPGQGYQLKMNNEDVLNYLPNDQSYRFGPVEEIDKALKHYSETVPTDNNMTIVLKDAAWDKIPDNNAEIAVYDNQGNLVGSGAYTKPVTVLSVWGDDVLTTTKEGLSAMEYLSFKLWDTKTTVGFTIANWEEGSSYYRANTINIASSVVTNNTIVDTSNRTLVRIVNLLGQEVNIDLDQSESGVVFHIFNDGTVEKVIR